VSLSDYIYDQGWEQERARLAGLEAALDPGTIRILEQLGVTDGWRCLEVGGGGGSITSWLCRHVLPSGSVVATDLDPRFLEQLDHPNLEVRKHNIITDELETGEFDLVHSRDLLEHLPERHAALDRMVAALKPGGIIMIEDVDIMMGIEGIGASLAYPPRLGELARRWFSAFVPMLEASGVDPRNGRSLPSMLLDRGLIDVGADVRSHMARGGSPEAAVMKFSVLHLAPRLLGSALSQEEIDEMVHAADDPSFHFFGPPHVAAWGRTPD